MNKSKSKSKVTEEQVRQWLGSCASLDEAIDVITSIANGEYKPDLLLSEIKDYSDE